MPMLFLLCILCIDKLCKEQKGDDMKKATCSQWNALIRWKDDCERHLAANRRSTVSLITLFSLFLPLCACAQMTSVSASHPSNSLGIYVATISQREYPGYTIKKPGIFKLDAQTHKLLWHTQPALSGNPLGIGEEHLFVAGDHVYFSFFALFDVKRYFPFLYAFSTKDGKELWHIAFESNKYPGNWGSLGTLGLTPSTADNESVYITSSVGKVYAFDARNGSLRWTYDTKMEGIVCPTKDGKCASQHDSYFDSYLAINQLTIVHTTIYGSIKNRFFALDAAKGTLLWSRDLPINQIITSPVAHDGNLVYIVTCPPSIDRRVCSLNAYTANNGSPVWRTVESYYSLRQLTIWDHKIYGVSSASESYTGATRVFAWNSTDGKPLWHYESPQDTSGPLFTLLVVNNQVYIGLPILDPQKPFSLSKLLALDTATGTIRWQSPQSSGMSMLRTFGNHTLYALSEDTLFAYKASDGSKYWKYTFAPVSGYNATLADIVVIPPSS
jgi:outer membrane protein assembly factor BamB